MYFSDSAFVSLAIGSGEATVAILTGYVHTCAISASGALNCWGNNSDGQLGQGDTSAHSGIVSVSNLTGTGGVIDAAVGANNALWYLIFNNGFTCALSADGSTSCFGDNTYGQLGNGGTTDSSSPVAVSF